MSEATVKALTDAIYDAYQDSRLFDELDNEQVYEAARLAAQTVEATGTIKAIVRAWLEDAGLTLSNLQDFAYALPHITPDTEFATVERWGQAIKAVSS